MKKKRFTKSIFASVSVDMYSKIEDLALKYDLTMAQILRDIIRRALLNDPQFKE